MKDKNNNIISAEEFDRIFDEGKEDILQYFDTTNVRRPGQTQKRVNLDCPSWMVHSLDREAAKRGITRQSLIKTWLFEKLDPKSAPHSNT